jgi:hypothetical protein
MPEIIPAVFKCREHSRELTDAVLATVEASTKVAGFGHRWGPRRRERSFRVVVHCDAGQDEGGHDLVFIGTYRP